MKIELSREGLQVLLANHYNTRGFVSEYTMLYFVRDWIVIWLDLVPFLNGISNFVGYLIPKLSLENKSNDTM